ncbi:hypothetical protein VD0002_g7006 [Verticillium dahliae]|uniref:Glucose-methanol-choline oxidoreductase N-terminal domain-containing protein n=1 Tax=Verticillium dahliae TaxID=27337 RepID=A0A2J8EGK7_VERDA|nr:hypothetical protein VdG2_04887 [Verticillium dahliae VDG2]KAF3355671.1 hypothetical protein VdG1_03963 [Verticillium dahliae VDG1]PNH29933.1 hypothetical protein BJF96_g6772 [Verticillium dahliae]PNH40728.1 hypothetical protein VD0004_g6287 [Verticillium dahliae]PNH49511.1 hypothetical protein VD0003_g7641 [Verticillium dahliae]
MPSIKAVILACLAAASQLASSWPTASMDGINILSRQNQVQNEYDYIIVGGGTSGLTVGNRLTENNSGVSVLVVEYGYYDNQSGMNPRRMFNLTSRPQQNLNGRSFSVGIGCVVGGSSNVNGQVFLRGTSEEYNAWAELGGPGSTWNWEGLLPYFRKGITLTGPNPQHAQEFNIKWDMQYWGTTSKIYATFGRDAPTQLMKVLYNAMAAMPGMTVPVDSGAGQAGLYWYPMSMDPTNFQRSYSRTGHWHGISRPNYQMVVGAKVNRILWGADNTATGIQFVSRNQTGGPATQVRARREVLLAAGTVHTPQVLMLSGVGPQALLQQARIPVRVDLPGVGSNFQDHSYIPSIAYQWGTTPGGGGGFPGFPTQGGAPALAAMIGLPVVSPQRYQQLATRYESQNPTSHLPSSYTAEQIAGYRKQQEIYARLMRSTNVVFLEMMMFGPGGSVQNLHPHSRGTILINPSNPEGDMIIDYRAATNDVDLEVMIETIKFMRRYMTTGQLAQYNARETSPGTGVSSDQQLIQWARGQVIPSVYHPVGTCSKQPREHGGVVDENLRVHGTKNLRVIDGSIMPTIVGATTSMAVYAIAEKAADLIKTT